MDALRNGSWLTRQRVIAIAAMVGTASLLSLIWLFGFGHGTLDPFGRPLGTDFSQVYAAGKMVLAGNAADVWTWPKHFAVQQQIQHSTTVDLYGWHYPPPFLLVAAPLALLGYIPALLVWQAVTLGAFAWLMWRIVPRWEAILLVLAAPVTLVCVTHGHNGFLTAFLLGGGLLLLERKPLIAGLLLGCLIYKPQLGLIIPPLLLVTRNWRAILGACISAAVLTAVTLLLWGWPVWQAFIDSLPLTRHVVLEQGRTGWYKIMSAFSAIRSGAGASLSPTRSSHASQRSQWRRSSSCRFETMSACATRPLRRRLSSPRLMSSTTISSSWALGSPGSGSTARRPASFPGIESFSLWPGPQCFQRARSRISPNSHWAC